MEAIAERLPGALDEWEVAEVVAGMVLLAYVVTVMAGGSVPDDPTVNAIVLASVGVIFGDAGRKLLAKAEDGGS